MRNETEFHKVNGSIKWGKYLLPLGNKPSYQSMFIKLWNVMCVTRAQWDTYILSNENREMAMIFGAEMATDLIKCPNHGAACVIETAADSVPTGS